MTGPRNLAIQCSRCGSSPADDFARCTAAPGEPCPGIHIALEGTIAQRQTAGGDPLLVFAFHEAGRYRDIHCSGRLDLAAAEKVVAELTAAIARTKKGKRPYHAPTLRRAGQLPIGPRDGQFAEPGHDEGGA